MTWASAIRAMEVRMNVLESELRSLKGNITVDPFHHLTDELQHIVWGSRNCNPADIAKTIVEHLRERGIL